VTASAPSAQRLEARARGNAAEGEVSRSETVSVYLFDGEVHTVHYLPDDGREY
jgi:hypothetical protein